MNVNTKDNIDYKCNIITIGDSTVGKTSLLFQYMDQKNPLKQVATVGIDYFTKDEIVNDKLIRLKIWDTAGQERYRSITDNFFKNANGIVLVFDVNSRDTFDNLKIWIQSINLKVPSKNIKKILIGNKTDLERFVSEEEAREFANIHNLVYFETSAKLNINIKESINYLVKEIYNSGTLKDQKVEDENKKVDIVIKTEKKKNCC